LHLPYLLFYEPAEIEKKSAIVAFIKEFYVPKFIKNE